MADIITELKALDDAALGTKLGFTDRVAQFKKDLEAADKLTGKGRDLVVKELTGMFTPSTYRINDMSYTLKRAETMNNPKSKECADFVNSCGCMDEID